MTDDVSAYDGGAPLVVHEKASAIHFLFGFLAVAFIAAGLRGHFGAETSTGRIVGDVVFGLLLLGTIATWHYLRKHPARLEITPEVIAVKHSGKGSSQELRRKTGELYFRLAGGRHPRWYMTTEGTDVRLDVQTFDRAELVRACEAAGWHFTGPGIKR